VRDVEGRRITLAGETLLTPVRSIVVTGGLTVVIAVACIMMSISQPWLGLTLDRHDAGALPPQILATEGPAARVPSGLPLIALQSGNERVALRSDDLHPEPQLVFLDYAAYRGFFERQRELASFLRRQDLRLVLEDGSTHLVHPGALRPLTNLPFGFWLQLVAGLGSLMAGGGLLLFRPNDSAARWCVLAGLGVMFAACTAAVFATREVALPVSAFSPLLALNRLGTCLATSGFIATIWLYPKSLTRASPGPVLLAVGILVWLAESLEWLPTGPASSVLFAVIGFPLSMLLAIAQWRRTTSDLRARAALKWFLLSWLGGGGFFVFAVLAPSLAGRDVGDVTPYAFGALLVTLLGLTFGVARYRLFDVEIWAFRLLLLVAGAFMVLIVDIMLINLLFLSQPVALTTALLVAGWAYFPARQWLATRLFKRTRQIDLGDIPELLSNLLTTSKVLPATALEDTLYRLFAPMHMAPAEPSVVPKLGLVDDGLALRVPDSTDRGVLELRLAEHGQRLFSQRDVNFAAAVQAIVVRFVKHEAAIVQRVEAERQRLAQDLHDDVGARLLTLLHRSKDGRAEEIRGALASLRETVYALSPGTQSLADALANVRAETADRCEAATVELEWLFTGDLPKHEPNPGWQQDLVRVVREAISNALRHATPTRLGISFDCRVDELVVDISNDGVKTPPEQWQPGIGLRGMRGRTQRMGGRFHMEMVGDRLNVRLILPLRTNQSIT